jgi:hypothetical protein
MDHPTPDEIKMRQAWSGFIQTLEEQSEAAIQGWFTDTCSRLDKVTSEEELRGTIHLLMPSTFKSVWGRLSALEQKELQRIVAELESAFGELQPFFRQSPHLHS